MCVRQLGRFADVSREQQGVIQEANPLMKQGAYRGQREQSTGGQREQSTGGQREQSTGQREQSTWGEGAEHKGRGSRAQGGRESSARRERKRVVSGKRVGKRVQIGCPSMKTKTKEDKQKNNTSTRQMHTVY